MNRQAVVLCSVALTSAVMLSLPAAAATGCAAGFQDAGGGFCTATFVYTGAPESLTVPAQIGVISAMVSGAEGGSSLEEQVDPFGGAASPGGKSGRETATVPLAPGATLTVVVGQAGTGGMLAPPGFGGYGGGGHATSRYGGNGGGGSFVFDANGVLIAAGGGGGGGYDYNPVVRGSGDQQAPAGNGSGAAAATDGQSVAFCCDTTFPPPQHNPPGGGGGATPTGPGLGGQPNLPPGYNFGQADGDPGSGPTTDPNNFGNGGSTHNGCCSYVGWAGGGGGGYYGGGGGGNIEADLEGGGGGGGAGYVTTAAISSSAQVGVQSGDGEVTISYYVGACDASCVTCSGPTSTECASCANGLSLVNGACVLVPASPTPTPTDTPTATPTATPTSPPCQLDVDGNGRPPDVATDIVYIARTILALHAVPTSFRLLDATVPPDALIERSVSAIGTALDIDANGQIDVTTDIVYVARHLFGLPAAPASFRVLDPNLPPDATLAARIDALCP